MDVERCTEVGGSWKGLRQGRGLRITICSASRLCRNTPSGVPGIVLGNIGIAKRKSWCCALLDTNHHRLPPPPGFLKAVAFDGVGP